MAEMRSDMLPDPENTGEVVKNPVVDTTLTTVEPAPVVEKTKGDTPQTPEPVSDIPRGFVPYQSLDEERIKRKDAERRLRELEAQHRSPSPSDISEDDLSEEGKLLKRENDDLKSRLDRMENSNRMASLVGKYPALVDKMDEFEEYRDSRPNLTVEEAAEVFVVQNKLNDKKTVRKGLESPTGGEKTGSEPGTYSADDIDRLMKTDYRKFEKLLKSGAIDPEKIRS